MRQIRVDRTTDNWTVRLVRDAGDVTVLSTVDAAKLKESIAALEPRTRDIVGRLLNKDMKRVSTECARNVSRSCYCGPTSSFCNEWCPTP